MGTHSGVRRVVIHVGAPKTGTTYLQTLLWQNKPALTAAGVRCPGGGRRDHHLAALDLRGTSFSNSPNPRVPGTWERIAERVRGWRGDAIISSELLAWATPGQITCAVGSFPEHEVHVVFTMRDLARQIPAIWQESIKNRGVKTYDEFLAEAFSLTAGSKSLRSAVVRLADRTAVTRAVRRHAARLLRR